MSAFNPIQASYTGRVDFLIVYLREAHALGEWPLGRHVMLQQPTTLDERLSAARQFREASRLELPLLVDGLDDCFMHAFGAHPMRYFVFHRGATVWTAMPNGDYPKFEAGYRLEDIPPVLDFRLHHT